MKLDIDTLVNLLDDVLTYECDARSLDDADDREAVVEAFRRALERTLREATQEDYDEGNIAPDGTER